MKIDGIKNYKIKNLTGKTLFKRVALFKGIAEEIKREGKYELEETD